MNGMQYMNFISRASNECKKLSEIIDYVDSTRFVNSRHYFSAVIDYIDYAVEIEEFEIVALICKIAKEVITH